jgi:hypothetical protein
MSTVCRGGSEEVRRWECLICLSQFWIPPCRIAETQVHEPLTQPVAGTSWQHNLTYYEDREDDVVDDIGYRDRDNRPNEDNNRDDSDNDENKNGDDDDGNDDADVDTDDSDNVADLSAAIASMTAAMNSVSVIAATCVILINSVNIVVVIIFVIIAVVTIDDVAVAAESNWIKTMHMHNI